MAKDKNIASTSQSKKPKLPKIMKVPSNLRRSSCQMVHRFDFSNNANDSIEVGEMGNTSESSEHRSTFGEETLGEEDFTGISTIPGLETVDDSSYEKTIAFGEGQYEHTSRPLSPLPLVCASLFYISKRLASN